jgi:para-nitrobenzyl esterase
MSRNLYSRREVVGTVMGLGAAACGLIGSGPVRAADAAVASTACGKIRGSRNQDVYVFKGVPYGASTAGDNRFMPPRPSPAWRGVRDALQFGLSTPQSDPTAKFQPSAASPFIGELSDMPEGEDCLVLNVYTRGLADGKKRPVMFWIHGGGFQSGSASSPGYDGTHLCKRGDVVVVSINHRLNIMGFTFLGDIGGDEFARTGNVGMLDIVQALQWVRDNIEHFGGDPHRVTIFGESGGGRKIGTLLAMPEAKGLFHRAVMESGATIKVIERNEATFAAQSLLDELQIARGDFRRLKQVPLDRLMPAFFAASRKNKFNQTVTGFAPVVDGKVLPQHPFDPTASAVMPEIPLIIGTNRTEMRLQLAGDAAAFNLDEEGLRVRSAGLFGDKSERMIALYRAAVPGSSPSDLFFLMLSDRSYCVPIMTIAERRAAVSKAPVYFYYFCWETPVAGGRMKSAHALEIPFVFDNTEISANYTGGGPRAAALADKMSDAWIAFARSGSPNTAKLPVWTPYNSVQRATMVFNDHSEMVDDPTKERRQAMQLALGLT